MLRSIDDGMICVYHCLNPLRAMPVCCTAKMPSSTALINSDGFETAPPRPSQWSWGPRCCRQTRWHKGTLPERSRRRPSRKASLVSLTSLPASSLALPCCKREFPSKVAPRTTRVLPKVVPRNMRVVASPRRRPQTLTKTSCARRSENPRRARWRRGVSNRPASSTGGARRSEAQASACVEPVHTVGATSKSSLAARPATDSRRDPSSAAASQRKLTLAAPKEQLYKSFGFSTARFMHSRLPEPSKRSNRVPSRRAPVVRPGQSL